MQGRTKRSVLEPHFIEIVELREKDKSYKYIVGYLLTNYNLKISIFSIYNFLKVREKKNISPAPKTRKDIMSESSNNKASSIFMEKTKKITKKLTNEEIEEATKGMDAGEINQYIIDNNL